MSKSFVDFSAQMKKGVFHAQTRQTKMNVYCLHAKRKRQRLLNQLSESARGIDILDLKFIASSYCFAQI